MTTDDNYRDIAEAVCKVEQQRREAMRELMRDFEKNYYYPKLKTLREACDKLGHKWAFTHLGPLGDPWFSCLVCRAAKCETTEKQL